MTAKEIYRRQLEAVRQTSERMLCDFHTPEQWVFQVHEQANHALWFAGHMGQTDNFLISLLAPDRVEQRPGYMEKFGMGSRPTSRPEDYPPIDEVLDFMRSRRAVVLEVLDGLSEEDLEKPTPQGTPDFLATVKQIFELAVWHEGMHMGQLTVVRRALGHEPLVDRPPPT